MLYVFVKSQGVLQLALVNSIVCKLYLHKTAYKGSMVEFTNEGKEEILEFVNTWKWLEKSQIAEFHPESGQGLISDKKFKVTVEDKNDYTMTSFWLLIYNCLIYKPPSLVLST